MSDDCEHEYELGQIATDPWNTLQQVEFAYYFCRKCLKTVKKRVNEPTHPIKHPSKTNDGGRNGGL